MRLCRNSITIEVQEKPWGGVLGEVEDKGTYPSTHKNAGRQWYHLWQENENTIRPKVAPSDLDSLVNGASFTGISVVDIEPKSARKRISDSGLKEGITATAFVGDVALPGTKTPKIDIMVNAIASVKWVPNKKPDTIQFSVNNIVHLAEVDKSNNPENGGGYRIFREQEEPGSNKPLFDRVALIVYLAQAVPQGMEATIFLKAFDPANPILKGVTFTDPTVINTAGVPDDNNGTPFAFSEKWTFQGTKDYWSTYCTIPSGQPGDNYIVAVHPNQSVVNSYKFYDNSDGNSAEDKGSTLMRPATSTTFEELEDALQSPLLTVWRTLWFELDRMKEPTEGTGDDQFDPAFKYTPGASGDRGDITKNQWMEGNANTRPGPAPPGQPPPVGPIIEPMNFDVKFQPPLPNLTLAEEHFSKACVRVQAASSSQIIQWSGNSNLILEDPDFVKYWEESTSRDTGRDVAVANNTEKFWLLHALGGYNSLKYANFDYHIRAGTLGHAFGNGTPWPGTILLYMEEIRDFIATVHRYEPALPATVVDIPEARRRLMYHEILHYFVGPHIAPPDPTHPAESGIMNTNLDSSDYYLFITGDIDLTPHQIALIQGTSKPQ